MGGQSMMDLRCGDCFELMQSIPNGIVDMILCDLPYGRTKNQWDTVLPLDELWKEYSRVIKDHGAIVLFSQMPFTATLVKSNEKLFRYEWIWVKTEATGFLNAKKMPLKNHENILVFYKKTPCYHPQFTEGKPYTYEKFRISSSNYGESSGTGGVIVNEGKRYPKSVITFKKDKQKQAYHPTQKPVALCEYLIKTYTNPGEIVLDNCMGSGSTGVACVNTGRQFIGMELDETYYLTAVQRIMDAEGK
jgi:site-specific DNA-methyltransferase (adenine-specific)